MERRPDHLRPDHLRHRRGAISNPTGRYEPTRREGVDDGWADWEAPEPPRTEVSHDTTREIICRNSSPDIPFDRSINLYRGCAHGCIYCYARPTHAYLGLSPGLDFETRLTVKPDAPALLRRALKRKSYVCRPLAIGTNTDPYQPLERRYALMRPILEILAETRHPVIITTKSALILRDRDLLVRLAADDLVRVRLSLTTLEASLARSLEPRATPPAGRLAALATLTRAGVPVGVNIAPVIPGLTDHELENLLTEAHRHGAVDAMYLLLRLPGEVAELFAEWLRATLPQRAERVLSRQKACRDGRLNDSRFGHRFTGHGPDAILLAQRFRTTCQRLGLNPDRGHPPPTHLFTPNPTQGTLFPS
ncbi:PA0069 family radical SAM protein [Roseospirillum parvum]|uniref:DNA repair photolyase n=1 Tax=Roseospirillum parvum TaxID=83401 RepID=A0A1G7WZ07_9PROT|nr:PA0069 family radical SAM protein [Roseospirillum parvum]SDG77155.1 DNA repair photolyase [Roseospirillum parvum]